MPTAMPPRLNRQPSAPLMAVWTMTAVAIPDRVIQLGMVFVAMSDTDARITRHPIKRLSTFGPMAIREVPSLARRPRCVLFPIGSSHRQRPPHRAAQRLRHPYGKAALMAAKAAAMLIPNVLIKAMEAAKIGRAA